MTATGTPTELTIDELARRAGVPARTIREYQTLQVLRPPRRQGRVGMYDEGHVSRLRLIARLQARGYSLAGIRDLLDAWAGGEDLATVLGDDELPMPDEPGIVVTAEELARWVDGVGPEARAALEQLGLVRPAASGAWCIPAPSLLRLVADATATGMAARDALSIVATVAGGVRQLARDLAPQIQQAFRASEIDASDTLVLRGRALLAQGTARLLVQELADAIVADPADVDWSQRLVDAARRTRSS